MDRRRSVGVENRGLPACRLLKLLVNKGLFTACKVGALAFSIAIMPNRGVLE